MGTATTLLGLQTEACFEPSNIIDKIERGIAKSFELLSKRACALRNLDLLQVDFLASGASLFWPRSGRPRATKSREVPRHMKSDEGLFESLCAIQHLGKSRLTVLQFTVDESKQKINPAKRP